jgi:hypothetical protein
MYVLSCLWYDDGCVWQTHVYWMLEWRGGGTRPPIHRSCGGEPSAGACRPHRPPLTRAAARGCLRRGRHCRAVVATPRSVPPSVPVPRSSSRGRRYFEGFTARHMQFRQNRDRSQGSAHPNCPYPASFSHLHCFTDIDSTVRPVENPAYRPHHRFGKGYQDIPPCAGHSPPQG